METCAVCREVITGFEVHRGRDNEPICSYCWDDRQYTNEYRYREKLRSRVRRFGHGQV